MATKALDKGITSLLLGPLCFAIVACNRGDVDATASNGYQHKFSIILYDQLQLAELMQTDYPQSGTKVAPPTVAPLDVWDDDELVGADWEHRTLEYVDSVRDRYSEKTGYHILEAPFAIKWDGRIIIEGWLIPSFAAHVIQQPVLVYDPMHLCDKERVVVHLYPNHYSDDLAPIAGLDRELDTQLSEYFADRLAVCPSQP